MSYYGPHYLSYALSIPMKQYLCTVGTHVSCRTAWRRVFVMRCKLFIIRKHGRVCANLWPDSALGQQLVLEHYQASLGFPGPIYPALLGEAKALWLKKRLTEPASIGAANHTVFTRTKNLHHMDETPLGQTTYRLQEFVHLHHLQQVRLREIRVSASSPNRQWTNQINSQLS